MATNGKQLFVNREFTSDLTIAEIAWVLLHEAGHVWLGHHLRLQGGDHETCNIAFDLAWNSLIRDRAPSDRLRKLMCAPGFGTFASFPKDQDAEFYYRKLRNEENKKEQEEQEEQEQQDQSGEDNQEQSESGQGEQEEQGEQEDGEGSGEQEGEGSESESGESESESGEASNSGKQGKGKGKSGKGDQGSSEDSSESSAEGDQSNSDSSGESGEGSGNQSASNAKQSASASCPNNGQSEEKERYQSMGEVLPCPDCDTEEGKAQAEAQWQNVVAESLALGHLCGNLPGNLKDIGERLLGKSAIDWKTILRRFLTKLVPQGTTYQRPSRRHSWRQDVILPAHRSKGGGEGLIIADTSGSIFPVINKAVLPEIEKILRTIPKAQITLAQIDTDIRDVKKYDQYSPLKLTAMGGGGTDLDPAFELAKKDRSKYKYVIVITDMLWSFQSAPDPGIPVLWIVVGNPHFNGKLPFGELVNTGK